MAFNNTITPVGIDSENVAPDLKVSPLHAASYFGLKKIVERLLNGGAAANATTSFGTTALHVVQDDEIATLLLKSGVEIDYPDNDGRTPLMHHAWDNDVAMVTKLLDSGANIKATCKVGYTPFHEAIRNGSGAAAQVLLEYGANFDEINVLTGRTALHLAAKDGDESLIEFLLSKGASVSSGCNVGETPLHLAAMGGHKGATSLLLQAVRDSGSNRDHLVKTQGENANVQELLRNAIDEPDFQGRTVLMLAGETYWGLIDMLLEHRADPYILDLQGRTCLHHAAAKGSPAAVLRLLRCGLDPNLADGDGWTPLFWAARAGFIKNISILIDAGGNPSMKLENGWTPYTVAVYHGNRNVLRILSEKSKTREDVNRTQFLSRLKENRTGVVQAAKWPAFCDGCELYIYGPRYKCSVCPDFDFCFKCINTAEQSHPPHKFDELND
ncbi:MAG: hypothetical protein Q9195_002019 [Heterodermia aff. obscurata]